MLLDTGRAEQSYTWFHLTRCMQCMENAITIFFMPSDPDPCDKKSHSEHQTLFPLFKKGLARDYLQSVEGGVGTGLV